MLGQPTRTDRARTFQNQLRVLMTFEPFAPQENYAQFGNPECSNTVRSFSVRPLIQKLLGFE